MSVSSVPTPSPRLYFSKSTMGFYDSSINTSWPGDVVFVTSATRDAVLAGQAAGGTISVDGTGQPVVVPYTPSQAQIIQGFATALQSALDAQARAWQYDSMLSASTYVTSAIAKYAAEGKALVAWRDAAWVAADALLAAVQAGTTPAPVDNAAFLAAVLPAAPVRPTA